MMCFLSGGPRKYSGSVYTMPDTTVVIDMDSHTKGRWCRTPFKNVNNEVIFAYVKAVEFK